MGFRTDRQQRIVHAVEVVVFVTATMTVDMAAADATITVAATARATATAVTVEAIATTTVDTAVADATITVEAVAIVMSMLHQGALTVTIVDTADARTDAVAVVVEVATATTVPQEAVLLMPTLSLPPLQLLEVAALVVTMMTDLLAVKALTDLQDTLSAILTVTTGAVGWKIGMATKLAFSIWQPLACSFISWVQRSK